ncbi:alpha/beta fold hydrolase [Rheinheimera riviphila]|uniref:Alpha/beta fold hydrolase n=1 Tax=Rheinheimera riviphila TaxID=1834037 RepID=A0A437R2D7_9GAMM|nr:alpha/beta fold hydrolase [Rheinheimera riviphila]RVU40918.1 alpha/beta fold hydrolase [Rheinheimera riviphila]
MKAFSLKTLPALMLAAGLTVGLPAPLLAATAVNPYKVLTETELEAQQVQIDLFWQKQINQGSFAGIGEVPLHYAYVVPANAKATIVILNGRTESVLKYQEMYFELARQGYAVFSYDHRGQGLSGRLNADPHLGHVEDFQHYVQDVALFMAKFSGQMPGPKLLMAHSMGGAIGSAYLAKAPTEFVAAAMSAPMHAPNAEVIFGAQDGCYLAAAVRWSCSDCYAGFVSQPYNPGPFVGNIYTQSEIRYRRFREQYQQQPKIQLGGPSWQWLSQACAIADEMPQIAANIQTPVLILQAGDDSAVAPAPQDEFCQAIGSNCAGGKVLHFAGARHEFFIEADQYRLPAMTAVLEFYQQQLSLPQASK